MSEDKYGDLSGNTAQFQAFASRAPEPEPAQRTPVALIVGIATAVIVAAVVVGYLLMS